MKPRKESVPALEDMQRALKDVQILPLTAAQEKSWQYQKADPKSSFYNVPIEITFEGPLDLRILESSLLNVVANQEALRTRIIESQIGPVQFLGPPKIFSLNIIDVQSLGGEALADSINEIKKKNGLVPFDLGNDPLFSATLIRVSASKNILLIRTHQIVCDGFSCFFILDQLVQEYKQLSSQDIGKLLQKKGNGYFSFIKKLIQTTEPNKLEGEIAYWQKKLRNVPPRVPIKKKPDNGVKESPVSSPSLEIRAISNSLYLEVQEFCKKAGLTPFMFILSAFNLSLFLYTRQSDLLIGSIINNRSEFGELTWGMAGDFTNPVPLRCQLRPSMSGDELLAEIRDTVLEAQSHALCPFEKVMESVIKERKEHLKVADFINIDFIMHNIEAPTCLDFGGNVKAYPSNKATGVGTDETWLDLNLQLFNVQGSLMIECQYNNTSIGKETTTELLDLFIKTINNLLNHSKDQISSF